MDVTEKVGIGTPHFAMGGAAADYHNDGDGYVDLMVKDYLDPEALHLLKGIIDLTD